MANEDAPSAGAMGVRDANESDSVIVRPNPFGVIARTAGSATALAVVSLVTAAATMLNMSAADDVADAKLYSSRGFNNLSAIHWETGIRLILAVVALLLAGVAGIRYSRGLPAARYTFSADSEDATESIVGSIPPGWVTMLIGSSALVSVLAVALNALAFAMTLHLHESPNFGLPAR